MYIKQRERAMFGRRRDGFQIEEKFTFVMIADIILEHKLLCNLPTHFIGIPKAELLKKNPSSQGRIFLYAAQGNF